jgi:cell division protein FtsQ
VGTAAGGRRWQLVRASKDAVPASLRRVFMVARHGYLGRLRRRARLRRRPVALATVVAAAVLLAGWAVWGTSLLGVREVRVTGTGILTDAEVREAAAVPEQTPLLRVRTGEVADRVAALPPVAEVRVRRAWPSALVVEVVERTAVAVVRPVGEASGDACEPDQDCWGVLDAEGVLFQTRPQAGDLPVLELAEPGPADPATRAALTVLAALTPPLRTDLASVTVDGPASIRLELHSGWTVVWGDERQSETKARVATTLLERDGEVIDVSAPEVVSVR